MSLLELGIQSATLFCWGLSVTHFYVAIKILIYIKKISLALPSLYATGQVLDMIQTLLFFEKWKMQH